MSSPRTILLERLAFAGPNAAFRALELRPGLNLVYGASNTGKSFACKAVDFMLGARATLPDIKERRSYESVLLTLTLPAAGELTLFRSMQGGAFTVAEGIVDSLSEGSSRTLSAKHDAKNDANLSNVLLKEIGLDGRQVATDASGTKRGLSFRDLVPFCLVDETSIQAERSPVESDDSVLRPVERSVFRLLLTGHDDSAIATITRTRDFKASKAAKLELVGDMLKGLDDELAADYPQAVDLEDQASKLEATLASLSEQVTAARGSIRALLDQKRQFANAILATRGRLSEIALNLGRFKQLGEVYASDIQRLESLEEAGFLLLLGSDRDCPLCGARPDAQKHDHGVTAIDTARSAAVAEIAKIRQQERGLVGTVEQLNEEHIALVADLARYDEALARVERDLARLAPQSDASQRALDEILRTRDHVRHGLELLARRKLLLDQQGEFAALKRSAEPKPQLKPQSSATHEFAQTVASVLKTWHFPGDLVVAFDDSSFDLKIDGKHRRDNGKGVRAILHAAFKVGLLIHCRKNGLPHPGFIVLDSPLVTYRDPMSSKQGPLTADEVALSSTTLKQHFFEHLSSIREMGQTVVLENVDPPKTIDKIANVHIFTGRPNDGRQGLL